MSTYQFVDLFSGCGGLSLGLSMAGLQGNFAIERDSMAFETFACNFLGDRSLPVEKFNWPSWLEKKAWPIDELLDTHEEQLQKMVGTIDLLAGGPPCQGFSFAGRRNEFDPRNQLFEKYVAMVDAIKPNAVVLENVPGMRVAHIRKGKENQYSLAPESYYEKLKRRLETIGYEVHGELVDASRFGVPQRRSRLIVIGLRKSVASTFDNGVMHAFHLLEKARKVQLQELDLPDSISAHTALSDLTTKWHSWQPCVDPYSKKGFFEIRYREPLSKYQKLMNLGTDATNMDSMRLARHSEVVRARFETILKECPRGVRMSETYRELYGTRKHRVYPMDPNQPSPTITTLPDDILHYSEPRILTVRESARLQSFPDWFQFRGKYTTGGNRRTKECPRYTQVGNAVPPLLARAIGLTIRMILDASLTRDDNQLIARDGQCSKLRELAVA